MTEPVFYQESIERHAPAVLSCLARMVNGLMLEIAKGAKIDPALRAELGNAVGLIMKATKDPRCP